MGRYEGGRSKGRETREFIILTNSASYARFSAARVRDCAEPILSSGCVCCGWFGYRGMRASREREESRKEVWKTLWI